MSFTSRIDRDGHALTKLSDPESGVEICVHKLLPLPVLISVLQFAASAMAVEPDSAPRTPGSTQLVPVA
jgi:hypothetical protein